MPKENRNSGIGTQGIGTQGIFVPLKCQCFALTKSQIKNIVILSTLTLVDFV